MATTSNNFSIFAEVKLDTSTIQKQLSSISKEAIINVRVRGTQESVQGVKAVTDSVKNQTEALIRHKDQLEQAGATYAATREVLNKTVEVIKSMTAETYALNASLVEFQKVSNLDGSRLNDYLEQLQEVGREVARTGKPKCLSLYVGMINQHSEPL